jgi:hypothetical protein
LAGLEKETEARGVTENPLPRSSNVMPTKMYPVVAIAKKKVTGGHRRGEASLNAMRKPRWMG